MQNSPLRILRFLWPPSHVLGLLVVAAIPHDNFVELLHHARTEETCQTFIAAEKKKGRSVMQLK